MVISLILLAILITLAFKLRQTCPLCGGKLHYIGDDPIKRVSIYECEKCGEWFL